MLSRSSASRADSRQSPPGEERAHARGKQPRIRSERTGGKHIDEQNPHTDELSESAHIVQGCCHLSARSPPSASSARLSALVRDQIRSKFFSISLRVRRSITGRPCG